MNFRLNNFMFFFFFMMMSFSLHVYKLFSSTEKVYYFFLPKRGLLLKGPLYWCTYNLLLILFFLPPERTYLLSIAGTHFLRNGSPLYYSTYIHDLTRKVVFKQNIWCKAFKYHYIHAKICACISTLRDDAPKSEEQTHYSHIH